MGNLFRPDSPLMRFMMLVTNLICLNVLWLISCIPVITAGAATTAMCSVLIGYIEGKDDAVLKPFFRAFRENFRIATPLWLVNFLIGAVMAAEILYLSVNSVLWLQIVFAVLLFVYAAATAYLYPILARYQTPRRSALFNCFALSLRHLFSSLCVVVLNALPIVLLVGFTGIFWKTIIVWLLIGFSLIAYLDMRILLPIFKRYDPVSEENSTKAMKI